MQIKKQLSNIVTLASVISSSLSLFILVINIKFCKEIAITSICFSLILDRLDGYIARKLNIVSEIGVQLDSFADMFAFSLLPSFLLISYLKFETNGLYVSCVLFVL